MRGFLGPARIVGRRFNSTSSSPASNPQVQKALEAAQKAYHQTSATVKRVAGPVGDRLGSALGGYRDPVVYNAKVFASLCRQVYKAEGLAPPLDISTWANAYSHIFARATKPSFYREALQTGAWAGLGVAALEAYGIFRLGEIIGRRHLVGYKLKE
ncbi:mitochondrial ATP synthase g subunit-domain-containing protein [Naematelia encephala]|uniref:Mitochondrial ATP synthase g subunit-domain-containing protein n=1 Tax=Naematelia encephala TaxID=71784 RepID=A0A1Y2AQ12_9TREE|nr:mitochondrial ATP synthase g subunit-domain-containing protein [Naematelia encephala]